MRTLAILIAFQLSSALAAQPLKPTPPHQFYGMCSASGAVALDKKHFAVADDEGNQIRIYRNRSDGLPLKTIDFTASLELESRHLETDLEGAARIGKRIYWIGSHGRSADGKPRPSRQIFFATEIARKRGELDLKFVGRPYKNLVADLGAEPRFRLFHFAEAATRAPKEPGALNIEGLAATPDKHLLIGFRNPVPDGKALVIPLLNPTEVIKGKRPQFGDALRLDLGGFGIRDFALAQGEYLIIGGPPDGRGHAKLFRWSGGDAEARPLEVKHFKQFNPEAIVLYPKRGLGAVQILSDDGSQSEDGSRCKDVTDPMAKFFRGFWIKF